MKNKFLLGLSFLCFASIVLSSCEPTDSSLNSSDEVVENFQDKYECISIARAIEIATAAGETPTTERYYVYGVIDSISNAQYGSMTITDGTDSLYVYGTYDIEGFFNYSELTDRPVVGDEVVLSVNLHSFNGTAEAKSGWIVEYKRAEKDYTTATIAQARDAAEDSDLQVSGTVAAITYAFGMVPSGFYLVDETSSIYVYGKDVVAGVKVGNTVTVTGNKTYYVLEDEQAAAEKWGYAGSCQLSKAVVIENDNQVNDFDTSWVSETTVKEMLNTPVTENVTNQIYKVNAFINKVEGTGFTNYYINDLDGTTGTYTYTQANGNDFTWLDKYDGKLCEVYVTAINCKATQTDCFYRFIPIKVTNDDVKFDQSKGASFALEYYVKDLFNESYNANPKLEVPTSVSNELIELSNVSISYASNNTNVITFVEENGKTYLNTKDTGKATVTATATYGSYTDSISLEIEVLDGPQFEYIDVKTAIEATDDTLVTVKGIAGPSLVNQSGFYLIDETGVIAVKCSANVIAGIKLGNEVIMQGTRAHNRPEGVIGQSMINDAVCLYNGYGTHDYSTASFDYSKNFEDILNYDVTTQDMSTSVFVVEVSITFVQEAYYSKLEVVSPTDASKKINLYSSGAGQYSWLQQFNGQTVTMEIALCNWNAKSYYAGCALAVITENGKVYNQLNYGN